MLIRILALSDQTSLTRRLRRLISESDVLLDTATPTQGPWRHLARDTYDLLLIGEAEFQEPIADLVSSLNQLPDAPEVVLLQENDDPTRRDELLASGCLAVVFTGLADPLLAQALDAIITRRREVATSRLDAEFRKGYRLTDFVSESPAMQRLLELARRVAASDSSLLILGETGVGKEWLARAMHQEGKRAAAPFIAVNCAAVPDTLLESELFGHERGAFTGAVRSRRGHFEVAHRGTIFLDEIADMSPHLQAKMLRVLQERKLQRLGAESQIPVDVRIMAATNRDLEEEMASGSFRRDLYYRLGVVTLSIPPLRERKEDIAILVNAYVERFARQLGRSIAGVRQEALDILVDYAWPGNVRELINVIERCTLLSEGGWIEAVDLPEELALSRPESLPDLPVSRAEESDAVQAWLDTPLPVASREIVARFERVYLQEQLRQANGRIGETAERCGISPRALYSKMKRHDLRKEDFRSGDAPSGR